MKTVLVIEPTNEYLQIWKALVESKTSEEVVWIHKASIAEGELEFVENKSLDAVIIAACMNSATPNTIKLVRRMATSTHEGPIIVVSGNSNFEDLMEDAGYTHFCNRTELPQVFLGTLRI